MAPPHPAGTKGERDQLRQEMTDAGCDLAQISMEMRFRFRMRPREAWRHAHGLTLQAAADRINALGSCRPGVQLAADASLLAKFEKWPAASGRRPSPQVLVMLAEFYGCDVADLLDYQDRMSLPAADLQLLEQRSVPPAPPTLASPPRAAEPQGAALAEAAADESAAWAMWAESTNVGDLACEQLLADVRALAAGYLAADPPLRVLAAARAMRDRIFALLEGHQHPRQTRDLYVLAGYLCGLLAWISSDLGEPHQADTHGRTAWLCAELAGHDGLRAWTLSTRSKIALWDGRAREAITHARRGAAHRAPGTVGLLLACQEADAWARLGAVGEASEALARVDEARAALHEDDDIGGLFSCDAFRSLNYTTGVALRTGGAATALSEAAVALALPARRAYGTEAQMRITLASAHVALGHPEGALEALQPVLNLAPEQRLAPMAARLREFAADIARSQMADARTVSHLQAAVEHWCLDSAPRHAALPPGAPGALA
ncbi:XRE family transcriptional regulator [Streptomyces sp. VTCC 41912]|uniref:XRE family transcriptional regulator n=1 Tax=Streptomyces sp. VTCC 41912 TaxID=3383243 RepID=UPI003896CED9